MYAYELFEQIKAQAIQHKNNVGKNALYNIFSNLYGGLRNTEGFSTNDAFCAVIGAFACVAANDGKLSYDEYQALNIASELNITYDEFFDLIAKFNKQEHRNRTIQLFDRITTREVAKRFVDYCVMVAVLDGNVALNEELFCESLCESYINRFCY